MLCQRINMFQVTNVNEALEYSCTFAYEWMYKMLHEYIKYKNVFLIVLFPPFRSKVFKRSKASMG